jgi:hypothetical protein
MGAEHDVLDHAHGAEQAQGLECPRHAAAGDLVGAQAGDRAAVDADLAAARAVQAGDDVERGGLAGAVRPDQATDLAGFDPEREIVDARTPPKLMETPSSSSRGASISADDRRRRRQAADDGAIRRPARSLRAGRAFAASVRPSPRRASGFSPVRRRRRASLPFLARPL